MGQFFSFPSFFLHPPRSQRPSRVHSRLLDQTSSGLDLLGMRKSETTTTFSDFIKSPNNLNVIKVKAA